MVNLHKLALSFLQFGKVCTRRHMWWFGYKLTVVNDFLYGSIEVIYVLARYIA